MTGMAGCRDVRHALGAYVLGAIDSAERAWVDEHLGSCGECREELAGLAGLPALLRRVPVVEAERLVAPGPVADELHEMASGELQRSLLARMARARRARRWRSLSAAAAAAVILALGSGLAGASLAGQAGPTTATATTALDSWRTASGLSPSTGARLTVRYAGTAQGTTMAVRVVGLQPGTSCQFQVTDSAGRALVLGRWRVGYGNATTWYPVSSSVAVGGLQDFQVTSGGRVVASIPVH